MFQWFENNDYSQKRLHSICIDVTIVRQIQTCLMKKRRKKEKRKKSADMPGCPRPLSGQYTYSAATLWSNHCFQTIGTYWN